VRHIAPGHSAKSEALRATIRTQFAMGRQETDPQRIQQLQANAIRALSNYMLYESGSKDPTLSKAMKTYHQESVLKAKQHQQQQQPQEPYNTPEKIDNPHT
jgi:hypothetical protein